MMPLGVLAPPVAEAPAGFSPSDLPSLLALYSVMNASDFTLDGAGRLEAISDLSGSGNDGFQTVAADRRLYVSSEPLAEGNPALNESGSPGTFGFWSPTLTNAKTVVSAIAFDDPTATSFVGSRALFSSNVGSGARYRMVGQDGSGTWESSARSFADDSSRNGAAPNTTALPLPFSVVTMIGSVARTQPFYVGARHDNGGLTWPGPIVIFGILDDTASVSDVEKIEGWIAHQVGISADLVVGHPYRDSPP